ncbi:hypothetical protein CO015_04635 [candidate division WWE3 bacterium CG_4_8_14_3_um_filter_42_11]|uniref:SpoVT-AbrB domain-containing protein n=3 Tax=Katanobacteria TaxID=422282 RepID=A0A2M7TB95_UNCKA|nr:MAG: hypothetical protein AUJ38_02790 [bacterium CG1_02_42_9]PIZ42333.1 MAG: hypothetical protein COY34_03015 [candidate division WWE3 bacterium CG_4_10_14_0_2_um_filter_42_8]PJA38175.1 MAG: hypothetical protein CO181_01045 [candidate division WWE3 bacterium CG_4_9_14_3_um_filter_43_9]PJC68276.1 MAG: hypothetical protein CO015_04635 [candidate division WWE3 bacterium CG_4_8_14_3_um_filter_42_11]
MNLYGLTPVVSSFSRYARTESFKLLSSNFIISPRLRTGYYARKMKGATMPQVVQEELIKIQTKGILTIPKKFRKDLFDENDLVRIKKEKGRLIIEPVRILSYSVRSYTDAEMKEFITFDAEETIGLKKNGLL